MVPAELAPERRVGRLCGQRTRDRRQGAGASSDRGRHCRPVMGVGPDSVTIQRRPNGATRITCGATGASDALPRRAATPYVIGQNGLALIRGPNHLAALERVFGEPTTVRAGSGSTECSASWSTIGLSATFVGRACTSDSVLLKATVSGSAWSSLTDVHLGDSLAQLSWEDPTAKLVSNRNGQTTWAACLRRRLAYGKAARDQRARRQDHQLDRCRVLS